MAGRRGEGVMEVVGCCSRCGVSCAGSPSERDRLRRMLAAHERGCPGGKRHGERWVPYRHEARRLRSAAQTRILET